MVRERSGWIECEFILDDPEAEEVMTLGQHVSIGARQLTKVELRWVTDLSIVPEGAIRGAQVIGRREIRTTTTALPSTTARTAAGDVTYGGPLIRRDGIGQVLGVR